MYEVTVEGRFTAAHRHDGLGLHGHDFLVLATVGGERLVDDVLVDFHDVERKLRTALAPLDHADLNASAALAGRPPTPAAIARYVHDRLAPALALPLLAVEVRDTETTGARYRPD